MCFLQVTHASAEGALSAEPVSGAALKMAIKISFLKVFMVFPFLS